VTNESTDPSPTAATDRSTSLIRLSGDFEQDVLPFRAQLYRFALSRTKNAADAEDLLQETMLSAFKAYGGLRPDSHLKSWLMTIMRNIWIDNHRVASRRPVETALDDAVDAQATWSSTATRDQRSAENRLLDADFDPEVLDAMGCLSESMRTTVFLVAVMGLDSQEAARVLGVSPGTVLTRMHRSRNTLRSKLSDRHPATTRRDAA